MKTIQHRLKNGATRFDELFHAAPDREEIVTLFIALLELLRLGRAYVTQNGTFEPIILHPGRKKTVGTD